MKSPICREPQLLDAPQRNHREQAGSHRQERLGINWTAAYDFDNTRRNGGPEPPGCPSIGNYASLPTVPFNESNWGLS
jgi:hypothetical protein